VPGEDYPEIHFQNSLCRWDTNSCNSTLYSEN